MKKPFTFRQFIQVADKVFWMVAVLLCLSSGRQLIGIGIAVMGGVIYTCLLLEKILIEVKEIKMNVGEIKTEQCEINKKLNGLPKEYKRSK